MQMHWGDEAVRQASQKSHFASQSFCVMSGVAQTARQQAALLQEAEHPGTETYIGLILHAAATFLQSLHQQLCYAAHAPSRVINPSIVAITEHLHQELVRLP